MENAFGVSSGHATRFAVSVLGKMETLSGDSGRPCPGPRSVQRQPSRHGLPRAPCAGPHGDGAHEWLLAVAFKQMAAYFSTAGAPWPQSLVALRPGTPPSLQPPMAGPAPSPAPGGRLLARVRPAAPGRDELVARAPGATASGRLREGQGQVLPPRLSVGSVPWIFTASAGSPPPPPANAVQGLPSCPRCPGCRVLGGAQEAGGPLVWSWVGLPGG